MGANMITELAEERVVKKKNRKYTGVAVASVINNLDSTMQSRVQIHIPSIPGVQPWASVASPMAGLAHGAYFMPQVGQQVLVAFHNGDPGEPYVIGALWNAIDRPPVIAQTDAVNKRFIRTPLGHELEFDDIAQTLKITSTTQQEISMDPEKIELQAGLGAASVQISTAGEIKINSTTSIELNAPNVSINGATAVDIKAGTSATLSGGASCTIQGAMVKIN